MGDDPVGDVAVALVGALADLPKSETSFLSYRSIGNIVGLSPDEGSLLASLAILTSRQMNILSPFFVYLGADEEEHVLSAQEFRQAKQDGYVVDPASGEKVFEFLSVTFPYFRTTEEFNKDLGKQ